MEENEFQQTVMISLNSIHLALRSLEERIDCIQHTICKNDCQKTVQAIRKYLKSDFRNDRGIVN